MFDIAHHPEPETPPNIFIEVIIKKTPNSKPFILG